MVFRFNDSVNQTAYPTCLNRRSVSAKNTVLLISQFEIRIILDKNIDNKNSQICLVFSDNSCEGRGTYESILL